MSDAPAWIALVVSTGGVLTTAWNARLTASTARRKLRLDLYDRRLSLWETVEASLKKLKNAAESKPVSVLPWGVHVTALTTQLWAEHRRLRYLFDERCLQFIDDYISTLVQLAHTNIEHADFPDDAPEDKAVRLKAIRELHLRVPGDYANVLVNVRRHLDFTSDTVEAESPRLVSIEELLEKARANRAALENDGSLQG